MPLFVGFTSFAPSTQTNEESPDLSTAIRSGNLEQVRKLIDIKNINSKIEPDDFTPLIIAIKANQPKIVKFLIDEGADINLRCKGRTPLMYACQVTSKRQIRVLLSHGAHINEVDSLGTTALMIAAASQSVPVGKILIRNKASLNARNKNGLTARDYSIRANNRHMTNYLRAIFERRLPNYTDGPYAMYRPKKKLEILYLKHDSLNKRTNQYTAIYDWQQFNNIMPGVTGDFNSYKIFEHFEPEKSTYTDVKRLFVIGDIHGQCDSLKKFLINNKITDKNLRWQFGDGHLVFLGDIFDRGENVTEALWLIYRLEQEAAMTGGMVHLILGNHELMTFMGDPRYVADKYLYLFKNIKADYQKTFSINSVLGRWLRSKNTILKINDILFVHGGIHPDLLRYRASIDSINHLMYRNLNAKKKKEKIHNDLYEFLISINGPFWYRGMIQHDQLYGSMTSDKLSEITSFYNVKTIMVGHSYLQHITPFFNAQVYGLDVPFYLLPGQPMEGLLINSDGIYKALSNGSLTFLKKHDYPLLK